MIQNHGFSDAVAGVVLSTFLFYRHYQLDYYYKIHVNQQIQTVLPVIFVPQQHYLVIY
jgi:hypothetical protein